METSKQTEPTATKPTTTTERKSDRELVVTRTFNAPASLVFDAWTKAELMKQWWVPKSFPIEFVSCEMDARVGGGYRFVFLVRGDTPKEMAFFGKYLEVKRGSRLVWTNEEQGPGGAITTVTFEEKGGKTLVTMSDLHASKEALDEAIASGSTSGTCDTFDQLDELLVALANRS